jgi:hypothetical protein
LFNILREITGVKTLFEILGNIEDEKNVPRKTYWRVWRELDVRRTTVETLWALSKKK